MALQDFIDMCHTLYDDIHGKEKINKIFNIFDEHTLDTLSFIYKTTFLERHYYIKKYANKNDNLNEEYIYFYINALQHFLIK